MAVFQEVEGFIENLSQGAFGLETGGDTLKVKLSNFDPAVDPSAVNVALSNADNAIAANVTECTGYSTILDVDLAYSSTVNASGKYTVSLAQKTILTDGTDVGPFQYVHVYANTATPVDAIIGYYVLSSPITLNAANGETLTLVFGGSNPGPFIELGLGSVTT